MTTARRELVDTSITRWYHCISKCVRSAFLLTDEAGTDRKQWIEDRLELLAKHFAVSVGGFAVMDNHLHVLCRLDEEQAQGWSAEEVVERWISIYPPRALAQDAAVMQLWVEQLAQNAKLVSTYRERLSSLGWFMKALKEPLSRLCNRVDGVKGTFWEARYKSIAILDEEALLATCAYIDLNPVAAGIAAVPEVSPHTSIKQRVTHAKEQCRLEALKEARKGSVAGSRAVGQLEQDHWLVPIEDRRQLPGKSNRQSREGMVGGVSVGSYLLLVEYTGRLFRHGKARISEGLKDVLDRLGSSVAFWEHRIKKMLGSNALRGCFFGCQPGSIVQTAQQRGKRTANLCPQGGLP